MVQLDQCIHIFFSMLYSGVQPQSNTMKVEARKLSGFTMPLNLHQELKSRLIESLSNNLPTISVQNGMFAEPTSLFVAIYRADDALPGHGALRNDLLQYISETPLIDFASDILRAELLKLDRYTSEVAAQPISELPEYSDSHAVAERLIDAFESLPWQYAFSFQLPTEIAAFLKTIISNNLELGPSFSIGPTSSDLDLEMSLNAPDAKWHSRIHGGSLLFPTNADVKWTDGIILQIKADGFVGVYGGGSVETAAERKLKAFIGLGIALRLFEVRTDYNPAQPKLSFYVHKSIDDKWAIDNRVDLNADTARVINDLKLNGIIAQAETETRKISLGKLIIEEITAVFSSGEKAVPLILAAQWLFESFSRKDGLLNYVQAMVVLEILLGDKAVSDEIGLGQLMRNRCAYMIGSSHADRAKVMKDFDEIYRVRSQIVHRGKAYLTSTERTLYRTLQEFCRRVIQKEVDLLRAEKN